jgi:hypothetical protein
VILAVDLGKTSCRAAADGESAVVSPSGDTAHRSFGGDYGGENACGVLYWHVPSNSKELAEAPGFGAWAFVHEFTTVTGKTCPVIL